MRTIFIFMLSVTTFFHKLHAQDCLAIKSNGVNSMITNPDQKLKVSWQFSSNVRYFKSFRHVSGTVENKDRFKLGTEVINHQSSLDLSLTRFFNDRWSLMINVPVLANTRSSLYEHGRKERHSMDSFGTTAIVL